MTAAKDLDIEKLNKHLIERAERLIRNGECGAACECIRASVCICCGKITDYNGNVIDFHKEKV